MQYLAGVVNCPLCKKQHKNPTCHFIDEDNLQGLRILCPVTEAYFELQEEDKP